MISRRTWLIGSLVAGISLVTASTWVLAQAEFEHLDRWEIRHVIRHVEEANDQLQDRIDDWARPHPEWRGDRIRDMQERSDAFDDALDDLKQHVRHGGENPWENRDDARRVVDAARELGRAIHHAEFLPGEVRDNWDSVRDGVNDLAERFHLDHLEG
jgi:hypothetical protein